MTTQPLKHKSTSKGYVGIPMEGPIARWYADSIRKEATDQHQAAKMIADRLPAGSAVLEVAPGPGYLSIQLARLGNYQITGLDISHTFVEIAQQKAAQAGVRVNFRHGNASDMPFGNNLFNFIVCQAAFKNFSEPVQALNEMHRVLKPNGQAVILDLRPDASESDINTEVESMHLSWFNAAMTRFVFKHNLLKRAYTQADFKSMAAASTFKTCTIETDRIGLAVWFTKTA